MACASQRRWKNGTRWRRRHYSKVSISTRYRPAVSPDLFDEPLATSARLAIIWDVDLGLSLNSLRLVCPKGFKSAWKTGHSHWDVEIPHPAESIEANSDFAEASAEDLPIHDEEAHRETDD